MEYRRFGDRILVRLDRGEEICGELLRLAEEEHIRLASVSGLGATDDFTVGVFSVQNQRYDSRRYTGEYEITSLLGTITRKEGAPYLHLHMNAAGADNIAVGGHLNHAVISATCELVVDELNGSAGRRLDENTGLNLLDFSK